MSGTHAPWSNGRCALPRASSPAARSWASTSPASAGAPGAGCRVAQSVQRRREAAKVMPGRWRGTFHDLDGRCHPVWRQDDHATQVRKARTQRLPPVGECRPRLPGLDGKQRRPMRDKQRRQWWRCRGGGRSGSGNGNGQDGRHGETPWSHDCRPPSAPHQATAAGLSIAQNATITRLFSPIRPAHATLSQHHASVYSRAVAVETPGWAGWRGARAAAWPRC